MHSPWIPVLRDLSGPDPAQALATFLPRLRTGTVFPFGMVSIYLIDSGCSHARAKFPAATSFQPGPQDVHWRLGVKRETQLLSSLSGATCPWNRLRADRMSVAIWLSGLTFDESQTVRPHRHECPHSQSAGIRQSVR